MIPKIIHLCWFGKNEYPPLAAACIESWKKILPEFEIKLWNEDSFDVFSNEYTAQAYRQKKWAFVSDYIRLCALEEFGGIYMDTDVEVIRDFSELLSVSSYVSSMLEGGLITAGFIAACPHHPYIKRLKEVYDSGFFTKSDGNIEFSMNPLLFTELAMEMYGFQVGKTMESTEFTIYPLEYFMPYKKTIFGAKQYAHNTFCITKYTYALHHDMGSWGSESALHRLIRGTARLLMPQKLYLKLKVRRYEKYFADKNKV